MAVITNNLLTIKILMWDFIHLYLGVYIIFDKG